jgi:hypothetical protein
MKHKELLTITEDITIIMDTQGIMEAMFTTKEGLRFRCQADVDNQGWYCFRLLNPEALLNEEGEEV